MYAADLVNVVVIRKPLVVCLLLEGIFLEPAVLYVKNTNVIENC